MRHNPIKPWIFIALGIVISGSLLLASCGGQVTPDPQIQIRAAVAATIASIPTHTPYPIPTTVPSPTNFPLNGLFCEYGFCIGHPGDIYLLDSGARQNPPIPSAETNGILFGYNPSLFMQLIWRVSDPNFDPQSVMKLILEETQSFQGSLDVLLIGEMNVYFQPTTTITPELPFGAAAVWQCGGRDFIWKVYTPQDGMARGLLSQSLTRFRCQ